MANNFHYHSLSLVKFVLCLSLSFPWKTQGDDLYMKLGVNVLYQRFDCGVNEGQTLPQVTSNNTMPSGEPITLNLRLDLAYNLNSSTTYSYIYSDSPLCPLDFTHHLNNVTLCSTPIALLARDGDQVIRNTFLSMDRLNMISSNDYSDFIFSCVPFESSIRSAYLAAGVLSLGRGELSFVSQLGFTFDNCFSYCLPSHEKTTGYLALGKINSTSPDPMIFAPLFARPDYPSLYFIQMTSITINGTRILIDSSEFNTIIDPGTLFSSLPTLAYRTMHDEVLAMNYNYKVNASDYSPLDLCFNTSNGGVRVKTPTVEMNFGDKVLVELYQSAIIYDYDETVSCLGFRMQEGSDPYYTFGGMQQAENDVLFDLASNEVGFRPNIECSW